MTIEDQFKIQLESMDVKDKVVLVKVPFCTNEALDILKKQGNRIKEAGALMVLILEEGSTLETLDDKRLKEMGLRRTKTGEGGKAEKKGDA